MNVVNDDKNIIEKFKKVLFFILLKFKPKKTILLI